MLRTPYSSPISICVVFSFRSLLSADDADGRMADDELAGDETHEHLGRMAALLQKSSVVGCRL
jgi:hypothetical protein